jgi:hypothetical protein
MAQAQCWSVTEDAKLLMLLQKGKAYPNNSQKVYLEQLRAKSFDTFTYKNFSSNFQKKADLWKVEQDVAGHCKRKGKKTSTLYTTVCILLMEQSNTMASAAADIGTTKLATRMEISNPVESATPNPVESEAADNNS